MMKRKILIIVLVIGGIVGYVHYNLEHYFFYYVATYDKHNGTFKYVKSLRGFDRVTLPGYHFEYNDDLLGEVESMIVQKNVIKRGDEVVVGPVGVLYYPNNKKTDSTNTRLFRFDNYGKIDKFISDPVPTKLISFLLKIREAFIEDNRPKINLQWIFNLKMAVENQLIKLIEN